jgi:hypothetical protein
MVESVDLDVIEADARECLTGLRAARERLSLDGLDDSLVAEELRSVESEIASKETVLERIGLAKIEARRRSDARAAEDRARARREAYERAVKLEKARDDAVDRFNGLVGEMAQAIRDVQDRSAALRAEARRAGISQMRLVSSTEFTGAVACAVDEHGVRSLLEIAPTRPQHRKPLEVPALPAVPVRRDDAGESPRREPLPAVEVASGPGGYYQSLRRWGATLETAVETVRQVYGEAATVEVLARAEDELETGVAA